jgi:hypothetical protein
VRALMCLSTVILPLPLVEFVKTAHDRINCLRSLFLANRISPRLSKRDDEETERKKPRKSADAAPKSFDSKSIFWCSTPVWFFSPADPFRSDQGSAGSSSKFLGLIIKEIGVW